MTPTREGYTARQKITLIAAAFAGICGVLGKILLWSTALGFADQARLGLALIAVAICVAIPTMIASYKDMWRGK